MPSTYNLQLTTIYSLFIYILLYEITYAFTHCAIVSKFLLSFLISAGGLFQQYYMKMTKLHNSHSNERPAETPLPMWQVISVFMVQLAEAMNGN